MPDKKGYPGPPGWGLGAGLTTLSCKITNVAKNLMIETGLSSRKRLGIQTNTIKGWRKLSMERMEWRKITRKAKTHSGL
jgi:hypothetical protein